MVDACDDRIREGEINWRDSKNQMVRQWRSTHQRPTFGVRRWIGVGEPRHSIRMVGARSKVGTAPLAKEVYNVVLKAPAGKFRVVGVDLFSHEDYLKGDYASEAEAYEVADDHGRDQWMTSTTYTTIRARTSGQ